MWSIEGLMFDTVVITRQKVYFSKDRSLSFTKRLNYKTIILIFRSNFISLAAFIKTLDRITLKVQPIITRIRCPLT